MPRGLSGPRVVITRVRLFNMEKPAGQPSKAAGLLVCALLLVICALAGLAVAACLSADMAPLLMR